jgi:hypothetical protein
MVVHKVCNILSSSTFSDQNILTDIIFSEFQFIMTKLQLFFVNLVVIDMCARYGCGANSLCTNTAVNKRTCTCLLGRQITPGVISSNNLVGSASAPDCNSMDSRR